MDLTFQIEFDVNGFCFCEILFSSSSQEAMLLRHHNEAESLHVVQRMDWEALSLGESQTKSVMEEQHVPIVHVSDDFDLP